MQIKSTKELVADASRAIETLQPEQAQAFVDDREVLFVDVREPAEWQGGHLPGAIRVPRGQLEWAADPASSSYKPDFGRANRIVVYCAAAGRSALAAKTLSDMGYRNVSHIDGGFEAWRKSGMPIEEEGTPA
ncbi:Rhodanese-related sulfurtransferase [Arboricoccus pini]|uniref:Rhodanese-related sulfurtransferase n=1 Tax=Arboricoccus pini TaxID=1963835 RepID=A0A212QS23_9PROT|nr:rhodanese-like domain-containing protein [Arboricoccus pini]SNB62343.1 Rhodanese-related sulfurtransferase [Arboricoccus pini]